MRNHDPSRKRYNALRESIRKAELALYEHGYADPDQVRYEADQAKLRGLYNELHRETDMTDSRTPDHREEDPS